MAAKKKSVKKVSVKVKTIKFKKVAPRKPRKRPLPNSLRNPQPQAQRPQQPQQPPAQPKQSFNFEDMMKAAEAAGAAGVVIVIGKGTPADPRSPQQQYASLCNKIAGMVDQQMGMGGRFAAEVAQVLRVMPNARF